MRAALIGDHISHSRSPHFYQSRADGLRYELLDTAKTPLVSLKELQRDYDFVNLTTPWKRTWCWLQGIDYDQSCLETSSLNLLDLRKQRPVAWNTDWLALKEMIAEFQDYHIHVLGDGVMADQLQRLKEARTPGKRSLSLTVDCRGRETLLMQSDFDGCDAFWTLNYPFAIPRGLKSERSIQFFDGAALLERQAEYALICLGL